MREMEGLRENNNALLQENEVLKDNTQHLMEEAKDRLLAGYGMHGMETILGSPEGLNYMMEHRPALVDLMKDQLKMARLAGAEKMQGMRWSNRYEAGTTTSNRARQIRGTGGKKDKGKAANTIATSLAGEGSGGDQAGAARAAPSGANVAPEPLKCAACGKSYVLKWRLDNHMKAKHPTQAAQPAAAQPAAARPLPPTGAPLQQSTHLEKAATTGGAPV